MVAQSLSELEDHRKFLENRAKFPLDELARRAGRWVAWSPDGVRIVAEADDPEALDRLVLDAGEDPERCITEGIPAEDAVTLCSRGPAAHRWVRGMRVGGDRRLRRRADALGDPGPRWRPSVL
jgi:hypothetical protein